MHTNDLYNVPDDQGRVLINVGRPENEPDVFLAPQIARIIKPHQVCFSLATFNNKRRFSVPDLLKHFIK